jgi:hypothetical protein
MSIDNNDIADNTSLLIEVVNDSEFKINNVTYSLATQGVVLQGITQTRSVTITGSGSS